MLHIRSQFSMCVLICWLLMILLSLIPCCSLTWTTAYMIISMPRSSPRPSRTSRMQWTTWLGPSCIDAWHRILTTTTYRVGIGTGPKYRPPHKSDQLGTYFYLESPSASQQNASNKECYGSIREVLVVMIYGVTLQVCPIVTCLITCPSWWKIHSLTWNNLR